MDDMTSSKPYLIRAFYEWIVDNGKTPYIVVDATDKDAQLPLEYVEDGKIILNIAPQAIKNLNMSNDWIDFLARFSGKSIAIFIPPKAVLAIYAMENGRGMVFPEVQEESEGGSAPSPTDPAGSTPSPNKPVKKNRNHLKVVK